MLLHLSVLLHITLNIFIVFFLGQAEVINNKNKVSTHKQIYSLASKS